MVNLIGQKLGKYEITERIARGGQADVYKAKQAGLERFVAIKVMHSYLAQSEEFVARFQREAENISQLRHPHIVQLYDFDNDLGTNYMVMEYVKGSSLEALLKREGVLSPARVLEIAIPIVDAVGYAHKFGIIHRDIKPGNILFVDEEFLHPVLSDFGITQIQGGEALTNPGAFIGTPGYMSPQSSLREPLDQRTDIYSLGVLLYEMLTGKMPYTGETVLEVFLSQLNEPLPDPRLYVPDMPETLVSILKKSLNVSPDGRFQTAAELKTALELARNNLSQEVPAVPSKSTHVFTDEDLRAGESIPESVAIPATEPSAAQIAKQPRAKRSPVTAIMATAATAAILLIGFVLISRSLPNNDAQRNLISSSFRLLQPHLMRATWEDSSNVGFIMASAPTSAPTIAEILSVTEATETLSVAVSPINTVANLLTEQPSQTPTEVSSPSSTEIGEPPVLHMLTLGDTISARLTTSESAQSYLLQGSATDAMFLMLTTPDTNLGLTLELFEQSTGESIGMISPSITAACLRISPSDHTYIVTVSSQNLAADWQYTLITAVAEENEIDCPDISGTNG